MKKHCAEAIWGAGLLLVVGCGGGGSGGVDGSYMGAGEVSGPSTDGGAWDGAATGAGGNPLDGAMGAMDVGSILGTGGTGGVSLDAAMGYVDGSPTTGVDGGVGGVGGTADASIGDIGGGVDGGGTRGSDASDVVRTGSASCMDLLSCIADCPDADESCPDACYAQGSEEGQDQLLALLTCMDQGACGDVPCIETKCGAELETCLGSSTTNSGTQNPDGGLPTGSVPPELVGHWTSPGSSEVEDFTFGADGSATHSRYKESGIGSCSMSVLSQWNTGSAVVQGDRLTVTLAEGTTSVAWYGGCGTGYTNPAPGRVLEYSYAMDSSRSPPGLWLTDLSCTGTTCETYFHK